MSRQSEALILRTYPFQEADLLVSLFTREEGKIKGVAKAAKRSLRRFGGALELMTHVVVHWHEREKQELVRLESCDIIDSPLAAEMTYPRVVALSYLAELIDQLLPDREPSDDIFRLTLSVLEHLQSGPVWMPVTYFDLWMVRLIGLLPDLRRCIACGEALNGGRAFFHALADGLLCIRHKRLASSEMSLESRVIAAEMFRSPLGSFCATAWPRQRGADLRKFLLQRIQRHTEKNLVTAAVLESLG